MPSAQVSLDGVDAELMPERALFLRAERALVVADLHFGKSESYRQFGVPSADGIDEETLERLGRAAMRAGAKVIVVVGDLTHHADGIGEAEMERFARFRERIALPIRLVEGNHDRGARTLPPEWCIDRVGVRFALGGVRFVHEPPDEIGGGGGRGAGVERIRLEARRGLDRVRPPAPDALGGARRAQRRGSCVRGRPRPQVRGAAGVLEVHARRAVRAARRCRAVRDRRRRRRRSDRRSDRRRSGVVSGRRGAP